MSSQLRIWKHLMHMPMIDKINSPFFVISRSFPICSITITSIQGLFFWLKLVVHIAKVWVRKYETHSKIGQLLKNPHILSYPYEIWWKSPHKIITFTKFHENRTKNVNFLLIANLWMCLVFFDPVFNLIVSILFGDFCIFFL